ncbi:HNH endonuclease signature motif containing protein [Methylocella sp.]|jgi:hypothetical protein|uniref:HNH endonuclease signature motif containing protein n=1 Tax=Methylocella sp. TaxID=1978226 RepID=UPI003C18D8EE
MSKITAESVRELFDYEPESGLLTRLVAAGKARIGDIAGTLTKDGYIQLKIDYQCYKAHRVIFLMMTGRWPDPEVDHIDRNPSNNAWINLREATESQNGANRCARPNNTGFPGVYLERQATTSLGS